MLKRLRKQHPIGYCIGAEVLFLGVLMLVSFLLTLGLVLFGSDLSGVEDYLLTAIQELAGVGVAVLFLAKTGKLELLRRRGSGFLNGLLVGMYPLVLIANSVYSRMLSLPDGPLRAGWWIASFLIGMSLVVALTIVPLLSVLITSFVSASEIARRGQFILWPEVWDTSAYGILFKTDKRIYLILDCGFGKDSCGFLEGRRRDEGRGGERGLGDAQHQRFRRGGLGRRH